VKTRISKKSTVPILIAAILALTGIMISSCVDLFGGIRPEDFPDTKWVAQNPNMFFEVGQVGIVYAQINDPVRGAIEIGVSMGPSGRGVSFSAMSTIEDRLSNTNFSERTFRGLADFSEEKMVVRITHNNSEGLLSEEVSEIVFIREELTHQTYIVKYPAGGVWTSEGMGVTIDFDDQLEDPPTGRYYGTRFGGTIIFDGELWEATCRVSANGHTTISTVREQMASLNPECTDSVAKWDRKRRWPARWGFFRFRSGKEDSDTMTFVRTTESTRYTFVRVE